MGNNKNEHDIPVSIIIELYKGKIVLTFYILVSWFFSSYSKLIIFFFFTPFITARGYSYVYWYDAEAGFSVPGSSPVGWACVASDCVEPWGFAIFSSLFTRKVTSLR